MDIGLAPQRIFALEDRFTFEDLRQRAMDKRTSAVASGLGGLLQRPKAEDITLTTAQRRLESFWHISGRARYVYERTRDYTIPPSAPEVRAIVIEGVTHPIDESGRGGRAARVPVREECREEFVDEIFVDGQTGQPVADAAAIRSGAAREVEDPAQLAVDGTVLVPPEHRASFVVRQLLGRMLRPVQADVVNEEAINLEATDLYYRPIWAFEFLWGPRDRRGVLELDALTGQSRAATSLVSNLSRVITKDALFDIGADTVGLLVPGGSIAVKVARAALDKGY